LTRGTVGERVGVRQEGEMSRSKPRTAERTAGAFLGPDIMVPVPTRTLGDDYADRPEPEDSDRVPEPEAPGLWQRVIGRITRRHDRA
jgi:hypothetical protein